MFKEEIFLRFPSNCKTEQREAFVTKAFYARFFLYIYYKSRFENASKPYIYMRSDTLIRNKYHIKNRKWYTHEYIYIYFTNYPSSYKTDKSFRLQGIGNPKWRDLNERRWYCLGSKEIIETCLKTLTRY